MVLQLLATVRLCHPVLLDVARLGCACRLWQDWSRRRQMLSYSCWGRRPASAMVPVLSRWVGGGGGGGGGLASAFMRQVWRCQLG